MADRDENQKKQSFWLDAREQAAFDAVRDLLPGATATFLHLAAMRHGLLAIAADPSRAKIPPVTVEQIEAAKREREPANEPKKTPKKR